MWSKGPPHGAPRDAPVAMASPLVAIDVRSLEQTIRSLEEAVRRQSEDIADDRVRAADRDVDVSRLRDRVAALESERVTWESERRTMMDLRTQWVVSADHVCVCASCIRRDGS